MQMDIMRLLGTLAKRLNQGRGPAAKQEGQWLKLSYGPRLDHWVRVQRIGGRRVFIQLPSRLSGLIPQVSITHRGGLCEFTVADVEGYKFPSPPEPQPAEGHSDIPEPELPEPVPAAPRGPAPAEDVAPEAEESDPEPAEEPEPSDPPAPAEPAQEDDLDDMTHAELDERAAMLGVEFHEVDGKLLKQHKIDQIRAFLAE